MNTIILEGPDGAGKSTLAQAFANIGFQILPFGVPPKEAQQSEESIFKFFFDALYYPSTGFPRVFDRLHLSDRIYAPLMRGGTPMTARAEALIERYLEATDGQIIICLPPRRVAFANWKARPHREYVKDETIFHKVYDAYAQLLFDPQRNRNFLWYDYTRRRTAQFAHAIYQWQGFPLPAGVVGSQRPRFLFVGDRPGPGDGPDLAFMTPRNCSGWLFDRLVEAGYEETEMAFVNTVSKSGAPLDLEPIIHELKARQFSPRDLVIVALGKEANQCLIRFAPVGGWYTMLHPQYAKRFKTSETHKYVAELRKIRRKAR